MTGITPEGIEIDRDFAAPPAAVFAAWTTAEHFARWFGGKDAWCTESPIRRRSCPVRPASRSMVTSGMACIPPR
jgi:uncharacterized protein YndB with AHSA1/START domain